MAVAHPDRRGASVGRDPLDREGHAVLAVEGGPVELEDCIGVARWDDAANGWVNAAPFPYCIDDARQYFSGIAEQGD